MPAVGVVVAAIGHVVSYRGRDTQAQRRRARSSSRASSWPRSPTSSPTRCWRIFGGILPQANFAILLVAVTSFDLKTRRNCYSSLWISLAILYLAAVFAWDYPFGILVALWAVCLAGFWMSSHLRRIDARVAAPARPLALALAGALALGRGRLRLHSATDGVLADAAGGLAPELHAASTGELENPGPAAGADQRRSVRRHQQHRPAAFAHLPLEHVECSPDCGRNS